MLMYRLISHGKAVLMLSPGLASLMKILCILNQMESHNTSHLLPPHACQLHVDFAADQSEISPLTFPNLFTALRWDSAIFAILSPKTWLALYVPSVDSVTDSNFNTPVKLWVNRSLSYCMVTSCLLWLMRMEPSLTPNKYVISLSEQEVTVPSYERHMHYPVPPNMAFTMQ